jgi:hypothetical protein
MASRKNVSASVVREWASENLSSIPEVGHKSVLGGKGDGSVVRGRLHPEVIAAFKKANKSLTYETASTAELPTVTFKYAAQNSKGANITKTATILTSEARTLLGHPAKRKGRFNLTELAAAYAASKNVAKAS